MWYAIIGFLIFAVLFVLGFFVLAFFSFSSRQDEEHAASVRLVDAKERLKKVKEQNKRFQEKYRMTFAEFEQALLKKYDESLKDYAEWAFLVRTIAQAQREIEIQQTILNE